MRKSVVLIAITPLLVAAMPQAAQAFNQQTSEQQTDPLINKDGEITIYIGTFLIIIAIAAIIGILNRRVEHAVFAALGLSLILIAIFFTSQ